MPEERFVGETIGDPDWAIHQLPAEIEKYRQEYPETVRQIGFVWGKPVFPVGYVPTTIDIFYGDYSPRGAAIMIFKGEIESFDADANLESPVTKIQIDSQWAYIAIGERVFVDRLNGIEWPEVATSPVGLLQAIIRERREGREES